MKNKFVDEIIKSQAVYAALRRNTHAHPEQDYEKKITSDMVVEKLDAWGYDIYRGLAKTGVVGTLKVGKGKKRLGLRAGLDASTASPTGGFCDQGHDGHGSILLCAAEYLAKSQDFDGTLHVIFQPTEELLNGTREMIDDGLFTLFPCDRIYALHNMPGLKTGEFYFRKGIFMASSDTVTIDIEGFGGLAILPEKTIDAGIIACYCAIALQSIVARNVSPQDAAVVTIDSIHSGSTPDVICGYATLNVIVRTLNPEVRKRVLKRITALVQSQAESFGARAMISHMSNKPILINGHEATELALQTAREMFGENKVHENIPQTMDSEDFAFMLEEHPDGCYFLVGNDNEPDCHRLYKPEYIFNEDIIVPSAAYWCALTEAYLK